MITNFKIDIPENEYKIPKILRNIVYCFVFFFAGIGLLLMFKSYNSQSNWISFLNGLNPLLLSLIIYLQVTGKLFPKKFIHINIHCISYSREIFGKTNIFWKNIQKVEIDFTNIKFTLSDRQIKRFDLLNFPLEKIRALKEVFKTFCDEYKIEFSTK